MLPDGLNPRVWLRDWLTKLTAAERARAESVERSISAMHTVLVGPDNGLITGTNRVEAMQHGLDSEWRCRVRQSMEEGGALRSQLGRLDESGSAARPAVEE